MTEQSVRTVEVFCGMHLRSTHKQYLKSETQTCCEVVFYDTSVKSLLTLFNTSKIGTVF